MVDATKLVPRYRRMVTRYACDIQRTVGEIGRVLRYGGKAVLVVGNCSVQSEFVSNSNGIKEAAKIHGLRLISGISRELPSASRYLPMTETGTLSKRLRTENVLTFSLM
jgi:hypothetical protein